MSFIWKKYHNSLCVLLFPWRFHAPACGSTSSTSSTTPFLRTFFFAATLWKASNDFRRVWRSFFRRWSDGCWSYVHDTFVSSVWKIFKNIISTVDSWSDWRNQLEPAIGVFELHHSLESSTSVRIRRRVEASTVRAAEVFILLCNFSFLILNDAPAEIKFCCSILQSSFQFIFQVPAL